MSYLAPLNDRLGAIIEGTVSNSGFGIAPGRFHQIAQESTDVDGQPQNVVERSYELGFSPGYEAYPVNPCDGFGLFYHDLTVSVGYQLTGMGDADGETLDEQSSGGTMLAITNRAATDCHDIKAALEWYENYAGLDPHVMSVGMNGKPQLVVDKRKHTVTMNIPFQLMVKASVQGAYSSS